MASHLVTASRPRRGHASHISPLPRRARPRRALLPALLTGVVTLAGGALALPTTASAIVVGGPTPAACTPSVFSGVGVTRSLELLSINAMTPCIYPPDEVIPGDRALAAVITASWRPAGSLTSSLFGGSCVKIDNDADQSVGITRSTLYASGRSAISGEYFVVRAVDGGVGNPDTFGVRRSTTPPVGVGNPDLKCGARDVATSAVAVGNFVAIGNPDI